MKKFMMIGMVVCLAFMLAAPAMAVDTSFSGSLRARGAYTSHTDFLNNASDAYMDGRFRLQTKFTVSDNLSVTTRFDALEKKWGLADSGQATTSDDNIDFDRAYMTFTTGVGKFDVGRMSAGMWGTLVFDSGYDADRIKFTTQVGPLTIIPIFQKHIENDSEGTTTLNSDQDVDAYILALVYKMEDVTSGLLAVWYDWADTAGQQTTYLRLNPFMKANFGNFSLAAEADYRTGQTEYDAAGTADLDKDELEFFIEGGMSFGAFKAEAGYIFVSGDNNATDNEDNAHTGVGAEWEKIWYLTNGSTAGGQLGTIAAGHGAQIIYGALSYDATEDLNVGVLVAVAEADEVPATYDDEYGTEVDLKLSYKIMDNLKYSAVAAFLSVGDYWKAGVPATQLEDSYNLFHALTVSF